MAKLITATQLIVSSSNTSASSYTTASISPTAKTLLLVAISSLITGNVPNLPTCTGAGMTWVEFITAQTADLNNRLTLFRGMSTSPGVGGLTFDFAGQNQTRANWTIAQFSNTKIDSNNGSTAIAQTAVNSVSGSNTGMTVTLGTFKNSNNATYGVMRKNNNLTNLTHGANFTELSQITNDSQSLESEWANNNQTSVNWAWNSDGSQGVAIAIELAIATQGGAFLFNLL